MASEEKDSGDWPAEFEAEYQRVRPLGKGAYGLVWLARRRGTEGGKEDGTAADRSHLDDDPPLVAVKRIGTDPNNSTEVEYARREIAILAELRHPCVIRLIREYPPASDSVVIAMTLAPGPNLRDLIWDGGALGLCLARLVSRHAVAAVSYLHGRGVIHRDLKPANIVLVRRDGTGARDVYANETLWAGTEGDDLGAEAAASIEARWKAVLVDLGFARALAPADLREGDGRRRLRSSIVMESEAIADQVGKDAEEAEIEIRWGSVAPSRRNLSVAPSRRNLRMSALGTIAFAAPEIKYKARSKDAIANADVLSSAVADYGMTADAYSMGITIREMLTGVPSHVQDIAGYIRDENSLLVKLFTCCSRRPGEGKRHMTYRLPSALPGDASRLVKDLTIKKEEERSSVRQAQANTWICGREGEAKYELPMGDNPSKHGDPVNFLKCAGN